jgi:hypothetical protein
MRSLAAISGCRIIAQSGLSAKGVSLGCPSPQRAIFEICREIKLLSGCVSAAGRRIAIAIKAIVHRSQFCAHESQKLGEPSPPEQLMLSS